MPAGFGAPTNPSPPVIPPPEVTGINPIIIYSILGVLLAVLLGTSIWFYTQYSKVSQANTSQFEAGRNQGKEEQKKTDDTAALKASLSDTRTYVAPKELGEFSFDIPKSYSMSSTTDPTKGTPLIFLGNPERVETTSKFQALRLTIKNSLISKEKDNYDKLARDKKVALTGPEEFKISGWTAYRYTGKFDQRDKMGTVVLVEVRDKTFVFQTDNNEETDLLEAFNRTLDSVQIR